jgi:hypothetical protein
MSAQRFLNTAELAERWRTSPETCRYWRHVGKGPRSMKIGRRVLYDLADIEAYERALRHGAARGDESDV